MSGDFQPTFTLPACPACSTRSTVERPKWVVARHVTAKTGKQTWILSGCRHAAEISGPGSLVDSAEHVGFVEDYWAHRAKMMFETITEHWSAKAREDFRINLEGGVPRPPGMQEQLPL